MGVHWHRHRDNQRPLSQQRRRIGGIIRGGDTPKQETLWAIEFESGKFAFGHANENAIFVTTSSVGREIWYADNSGVIAGSTESVDEVTDTIIDTYNEHFGTRISHLTPEAKTFNVGDWIKNWNAYEKIEMSSRKIAYNIQSTLPTFIFGTIVNNVLHLDVDTNETSWCALNDGNIIDSSGPGVQAKTWIIQQLSSVGISITDVVGNIVEYETGQNVPDWSEYEKLNV